MDQEEQQLSALFPNIAAQLRAALSNLHLAAAQLAPPDVRDRDPALDARAALLDQSYYQVLRLVSNLSAISVFYKGTPLPLQNRDVVALVETVCEQAASLAPLRGLTLHFQCSMDHHLCGIHREGLELLLFQLLSNAFKFTPSGGSVTVELKLSNKQLLLSVSDTGPGISPEQLDTLFDRYLHPDQMDPPPHGLGLGLPLCRRIAEGLNGRIVAESPPGKGARFTLSIPDQQASSTGVSDIALDYTGGFNPALLALADALPPEAFLLRNQD